MHSGRVRTRPKEVDGHMNVERIGTVRSPITEPVDEGWNAVEAEIHLSQSLAPGLRGIEEFSHILVVFLMHRATFDAAADLVRRPRGRPDMPAIGIFAQRARHRPTAIGVTAARLRSCEGNVLRVRGLDAIDGTPVLDIKPYYPAFDRVCGARTPEWVDRLMEDYS
jgi:tRNA-Thr(GGU) m(6)t(6)A37 methyltransferase TsaA